VSDPSLFYEQVGQSIQRVRKKRRLSQQALASAVHLKRSSISNIEQGRQQLMLHTLVAIADALSVELVALVPARNAAQAKLPESELRKYTQPERAFIEAGIRRPVQPSKQSKTKQANSADSPSSQA
jgi:transcriptional regulator with XRE-family HTH domain